MNINQSASFNPFAIITLSWKQSRTRTS